MDENKESQKHSFRIATWAHGWGDPILFNVARVLNFFHITPNLLTILGFVLSGITAVILGKGFIVIAGWILLPAGLCDVLDGPLAQLTNKKSKLGAFLDSALDQYSDVLIFLGIIWFYLHQSKFTEVMLAVITLSAALLVSYVRAKALTLGVECRIGPLGRFERTLLTIIGLIANQPTILIYVLVFLTNYTALRRLIFILSRIAQEKT